MNPPLTSSGLWSFLKAKSKSGPFEGCLNIFNPLIKLTIQSQVVFKASLFWLFHLDYFVWRLWKEPRHVSRVANSRDNVQVRKFSAIFARISSSKCSARPLSPDHVAHVIHTLMVCFRSADKLQHSSLLYRCTST